MQIIIPMSGFGERFRRVGYDLPKPLIEVNGKPIIQHVVEMFPGETNFIFICNRDHLETSKYGMREILERVAPEGKIIDIDPHKLGPVHAVLQAIDLIDLKLPTVVNYADFTCYWNYLDFLKSVRKTNCEGAIPCYKGFHPHSLRGNFYAYVKEENKWANDIQEKKPFTDNPKEEFASSGTYYFRTAEIMKSYFEKSIIQDLKVGDEYYVSMAYKPMMDDRLNVLVYELQHFMQWGTPEDLAEYNYWSDIFYSVQKEKEPPHQKGTLMIPMAGLGSRFKDKGYEVPKPLIPVSSKPMAIQAISDLPKTDYQRFVLRKDSNNLETFSDQLLASGSNTSVVYLDSHTDGQASTCVEGSKGLNGQLPLTIAACDNGLTYDGNKFKTLFNSRDVDVIVWGACGYPGAVHSPEMYGWIETEEDTDIIKRISVKETLDNPSNDPIVVGVFTFKKLDYFLNSVKKMKQRKALVNGEYYVDTCINDAIELGLRCLIFNVDKYICWGTPDDLSTFNYWQSCFHKWNSHSYSLSKDPNIPKDGLKQIEKDMHIPSS